MDHVSSWIRKGSGRCLLRMGGKGGCAYEDQGVDDGAPDRSRQTLQAKRPSPGISEAQDQVIQRRETGLKNRFFQGRRYAYPSLFLQVIITDPDNELDNVSATRRGAPQTSATSSRDFVRSDLRALLVDRRDQPRHNQ